MLKTKNLKKQKIRKYFSKLVFLIFIFFLFPSPSLAQSDYNVNCPTPPSGKRYAVFVAANNDNGNPNFEPIPNFSFCVLVDQNDQTVSYDQLKTIGALQELNTATGIEFNSAGKWLVNEEITYCSAGVFQTAGWWRNNVAGFAYKQTLDNVSYKLQKTVSVPNQSCNSRVRYTTPAVNGGRYLYFIGFSDEVLISGTINCLDHSAASCPLASCFVFENKCESRQNNDLCFKLRSKDLCDGGAGSKVCKWNEDTGKCNTLLQSGLSGNIDFSRPGAFPPCGHDGTCDSLNDILQQQLGYATWAFGFAGLLAFISFLVGGITMITSFGNPEKFKKGVNVLVASVVGLVIVFSAYLLVNFLLDAFGVIDFFRPF